MYCCGMAMPIPMPMPMPPYACGCACGCGAACGAADIGGATIGADPMGASVVLVVMVVAVIAGRFCGSKLFIFSWIRASAISIVWRVPVTARAHTHTHTGAYTGGSVHSESTNHAVKHARVPVSRRSV